MMQTSSILKAVCLFPLLVPLATSNPLDKRAPTCTDVTIPVTISAQNANLSALLTSSGIDPVTGSISGTVGVALGLLLSTPVTLVFDQAVSGTWNIAARYCEPSVINSARHNTLQVFAHGATKDKNYFSGTVPPGMSVTGDTNSEVAYAASQGYPTLAIDALGSGNSDHPDPITIIQYPTLVEVHHAIIAKARAGTSPLPRAFNKILFVGQQYGSILGEALVAKYPTDVDALILTGYSSAYIATAPIDAGALVPLPAHVVNPTKFTYTSLGYLVPTLLLGNNLVFFAGSYNALVSVQAFNNANTVALGVLATFAAGIVPAPAYTGPVYMMAGQHDYIFCNVNPPLQPDCGTSTSGPVRDTQSLFPNAASFDVAIVVNSGEDWQLHTAAPTAFATMQTWITGKGF